MRATVRRPQLGYRLPDSGSQGNVEGPKIEEADSYHVHYEVNDLKHTDVEALPPLFLTFASLANAQSFAFQYRILPRNAPDETEGELYVRVETDL